MADPVRLDLRQFTERDLKKIAALGDKVRLTHRWYRSERSPDGAIVTIYSGDRGPVPYASYQIAREADGTYRLTNTRTGSRIAAARTIDSVLDAVPDDFFYSGRH